MPVHASFVWHRSERRSLAVDVSNQIIDTSRCVHPEHLDYKAKPLQSDEIMG
jgi:hypothetical protein